MCNSPMYSQNNKTGGVIKMKQTNLKSSMLKVVEKVVQVEVKRIDSKWPPACIGIYHQPKRPVQRIKK